MAENTIETVLGKASFVPRGAWSGSLSYERLNLVTDSHAIYVAKKSVPSGTELSDTEYWMQMAGVPFEIGEVETVAADAGADVTIGGTESNPTLNFQIPRGVTGNESIDDTKGEGDTDYVWSADKCFGEINGLKNTITFADEAYYTNWEAGSYRSSNGEAMSSTTIVRSPDYYDYGDNTLRITITPKDGYWWSGRYWRKSDGVYQGAITDDGDWIKTSQTVDINHEYRYKFCAKKSDSSTIDVDELPDDMIGVTYANYTDKSLTVSGKPADAKATGDKVEAIGKDNLVINTLSPDPDTEDISKRIAIVNSDFRAVTNYGNMIPSTHGYKVVLRDDQDDGRQLNLHFRYKGNLNEVLDPTKKYTLSFDYVINFGASINFIWKYGYLDGTTVKYVSTHIIRTIGENEIGQDISGHYSFTFGYSEINKPYWIGFFNSGSSYHNTDTFTLNNIMLVEGETEAPWKPSIYDFEKKDVSKKSRTGQFEFFSVETDSKFIFSNGEESSETPENIECILGLPESYDPQGEPVRLVLCCHGTNGYISKDDNYWGAAGIGGTGYYNFPAWLIEQGYAVFDCNTFTSDAVDSFGNQLTWEEIGRHRGSPRFVSIAKKAYDYILENYNVYDKIFVHGYSMGAEGATSFAKAYPHLVLAGTAFDGWDIAGEFEGIADGIRTSTLDTYLEDRDLLRPWGYSSSQQLLDDKLSHILGVFPGLTLKRFNNDGTFSVTPNREQNFVGWLDYFGKTQDSLVANQYLTANLQTPFKIWRSTLSYPVGTEKTANWKKAYINGGSVIEMEVYDDLTHSEVGSGLYHNMRNQLLAWYKRWE